MIEPSFAKTVAYGLLATISLNLGRGLQKYGVDAIAHPKKILSEKGYPFRFFIWCVGTAGMVASTFLTFAACAYGPVTIVAALSGVGLVALALFSAFVLRESVGRMEIFAMGLILFGTVLAGYFEKWDRIANYGFAQQGGGPILHRNMVVFGLAVLIIGVGMIVYCIRNERRAFGVIFGGVAGICGGTSVFFQKACMIRCGCSDIFADIPSALVNPFFYLFIVTGFLDFLIIQYALTKAKAVTVVPSYQSFYIIVPIVGGMVAYFDRVNLVQFCGLILLLWGVLVLSRFLGRAEEP